MYKLKIKSFFGFLWWQSSLKYHLVCQPWLQLNRFCIILSIVKQLEEFFIGQMMWGKCLEICRITTTKDVYQIWWISPFGLLQICCIILGIFSLLMYSIICNAIEVKELLNTILRQKNFWIQYCGFKIYVMIPMISLNQWLHMTFSIETDYSSSYFLKLFLTSSI